MLGYHLSREGQPTVYTMYVRGTFYVLFGCVSDQNSTYHREIPMVVYILLYGRNGVKLRAWKSECMSEAGDSYREETLIRKSIQASLIRFRMTALLASVAFAGL